MAFELPANLRATPFEAQPGPLVLGGLTLEQHARVSGEIEGVPDPEPIFARYGLGDRARRAMLRTGARMLPLHRAERLRRWALSGPLQTPRNCRSPFAQTPAR